jgi:SNF2 family DNA or RNA helicase
MRKHFTPKAYQPIVINHIIDHPRCGVFAGMGMGKTSSALTAISYLLIVERFKTLVIAPLRVAATTWPDEVAKWAHLSDIRISPIVGDPSERRAALRQDADIYTINYENLPWLRQELGDDWPFAMIVLDESTRVKAFRGSYQTSKTGKRFLRVDSGTRAKALAQVAHAKAERLVVLTGTPAPNGLQDLWAQLWFVDAGQRLGRTFEGFKNRWFQAIKGDGGFDIKITPYDHAQLEIQERITDVCISLNAKDYFDLRDPIVSHIEVELPPKAKRVYREMEKQLFIELEGHQIEAVNAASKTIKCLQLANGAIYHDDQKSFTSIHDGKLDALDSIIEEANGMPVIVAYHFKSDLSRLQKRFPKGRTISAGGAEIGLWNRGEIPILFLHPASAGHGLSLQDGGNIIVFFGHWWNLEEYQQIIERIGPTRQAQAGHDRPVFIYHIIAKGTLDEVVMQRRESKRDVQDLLLEAMKHRSNT